jgi:hypothetical protein
MENIEERIKALPPELRQEIEDFVEFIYSRWIKKTRSKPNFDWGGALKDLKEQYTSVELQHKISDWRIEAK